MDKTAFGKRINQARKEKELTSDKLAELCDMAPVFVRQIEGGTRLPSIPNLVAICNALQVSPNFLLGDDLEFSDKEIIDRLVSRIRTLSPKQVEMVCSTIETMIDYL